MFLINTVILYFHRFRSSEDSVRLAEAHRNYKRKLPLSTPAPGAHKWESEPETFLSTWFDFPTLDKATSREIFGGKRPDDFKNKHDEQSLSAMLSLSSESSLRLLRTYDMLCTLNGGAPLIDMVISDYQQNHGGHAFPSRDFMKQIQSKRGISSSTLTNGHTIYELTVGDSSIAEIDEVIEFFNDRRTKTLSICPLDVIGTDITYVHVSKEKSHRLLSSGRTNPKGVVIVPAAVAGQDQDAAIPAKLLIGEIDWTISVRFSIKLQVNQDGSQDYVFHNSPIQPKLEAFLKGLPTLAGFNLYVPLKKFCDHISMLTSSEFEFRRGYINLECFAVLAGIHSKFLNAFNLTFQILGSIFNTDNSEIDNMWFKPLHKIPGCFQILTAGYTRASYSCAVTLFSAFIRNVFPDPDVVCMGMNRPQFDVALWFGNLVLDMLNGVHVDLVRYRAAKTRKDLVFSLKDGPSEDSLRYGEARVAQDWAEPKLALFAEIIPSWPSVSNGSARFLHPHRLHFRKQVTILRDDQFDSKLNAMLAPKHEESASINLAKNVSFTPQLLKMITYDGQRCDPLSISSGSDVGYLTAVPSLKYKPAEFDPHKVLNGEISAYAKSQGRESRYVIMEWTRLHDPKFIRVLLGRASNTIPFSQRLMFSNLSRYEDLRSSYEFTTGRPSATCAWAEAKMSGYMKRAQIAEKRNLQIAEAKTEAVRKRSSHLAFISQEGDERKRAKLRQDMPPHPSTIGLSAEQLEARKVRNRKARLRQKKKKAILRQSDAVSVPTELVEEDVSSHLVVNLPDSEEHVRNAAVYARIARDFRADHLEE